MFNLLVFRGAIKKVVPRVVEALLMVLWLTSGVLEGQVVSKEEVVITPTWETQKQTRMHVMGIPAPRGQIVDRHGAPMAQNRIGYNLCITFPPQAGLTEEAALSYARQRVAAAERLLARRISVNYDVVSEHYRNRPLLPFEIVQDLLPAELAVLQKGVPEGLMLRPVYVRFYPNGQVAGHILGYVGRAGRMQTGPIRENEMLWPEFEGRDGIEQAFNSQLTGSAGQMNITFDSLGKQISEVVSIPPQAGSNVILTLDLEMQRAAEDILAKDARRGALVVVEPSTGDILVLASWPVFNPNTFVPFLSSEQYQSLQEDPSIPLLPRAYRSSYPAGSIYKVVTGIAALESGAIRRDSYFDCPPVFNLAGLSFRNWKKEHAGSLNFAEALTQSCNTWFYKVGIKTGKAAFIEWERRLGLGEKTGIPLTAEAPGRVPTDEYMMQLYKRPIMDGDMANMSIGQGDILVSPIQMAQLMMIVANGGTFYQLRLVSQVQDLNNRIKAAYSVRVRDRIPLQPETVAALHKGLYDVVHSGSGTAASARVKGLNVCGKTGTAQWGPKRNERTAAWFIGFAPRDEPRYAFAALYEGAPNDHDVHGGSHAAPLIGKFLRKALEIEKTRAAERESAGAQGTAQSEGSEESPEAEEMEVEEPSDQAPDMSN